MWGTAEGGSRTDLGVVLYFGEFEMQHDLQKNAPVPKNGGGGA